LGLQGVTARKSTLYSTYTGSTGFRAGGLAGFRLLKARCDPWCYDTFPIPGKVRNLAKELASSAHCHRADQLDNCGNVPRLLVRSTRRGSSCLFRISTALSRLWPTHSPIYGQHTLSYPDLDYGQHTHSPILPALVGQVETSLPVTLPANYLDCTVVQASCIKRYVSSCI